MNKIKWLLLLLLCICLTACEDDKEAKELELKMLGEKVVTKTEKMMYNEISKKEELQEGSLLGVYINNIGYTVLYKGRISVITHVTEYEVPNKDYLEAYGLTPKKVKEDYDKLKKDAERKGEEKIYLSGHEPLIPNEKRYQYVYTDKGKLIERVEL